MRTYKPRTFDLSGLAGISDKTLEMHFKLYEGYVTETNGLNTRIAEILQDSKVSKEEKPEYSELKRRLGFEYNGMVLHELYFENLKRDGGGEPGKDSSLRAAAEASFGTYARWRADFAAVGTMRGVGWAICYRDPHGALSNHWISLHESGNVAGYEPVLVMDVWEHAYLLDYAPADRPKYVEAFFANISWAAAESRLRKGTA